MYVCNDSSKVISKVYAKCNIHKNIKVQVQVAIDYTVYNTNNFIVNIS